MIKSLSPYYVTTPWVNPLGGAVVGESYTISIFVWDGLKAAPSLTATYTKTIPNPTSSVASDKINISRLISDFIEFAPRGTGLGSGVINSENNWWVKTHVTYENDPTVQQATTSLYGLGYSYGNQGENVTTITDNILLKAQDYKANRTSVFVLPVLQEEAGGEAYSIISYPANEINISSTLGASTDSAQLVRYLWVQLDETTTDTYVEVIFDGTTTTLLIQDECKYTPIDIFFQNKEGAEQVVTFFKEKTDALSVTNEQYESDRGQPSAGNHQFVRYNVQGMSSFNVNSGFLDEDMNDIFTEMFLSERIWSYDGTDFTPLNIKSKNFEYKTRQKERLINYAVRFEYSYNQINNI
tara:strand:+ start:1238 stop:2299 length:1062 start_codon:yes stop_codon:yes gene_type:complete